jgi:hypothetical protein
MATHGTLVDKSMTRSTLFILFCYISLLVWVPQTVYQTIKLTSRADASVSESIPNAHITREILLETGAATISSRSWVRGRTGRRVSNAPARTRSAWVISDDEQPISRVTKLRKSTIHLIFTDVVQMIFLHSLLPSTPLSSTT